MIELQADYPAGTNMPQAAVKLALQKKNLQFLLSASGDNKERVRNVANGVSYAVSSDVIRTVGLGNTACTGTEAGVLENPGIGGRVLPELALNSHVIGLARPARSEKAHSFEVLLQDIIAKIIARSSAEANDTTPKHMNLNIREENAGLEQTHNRRFSGINPKKMSVSTVRRLVFDPNQARGSSSLRTGLEHSIELGTSNNKIAFGPTENTVCTQHEQRMQRQQLQNAARCLTDSRDVRELFVNWVGNKNRYATELQGSRRVDLFPSACPHVDIPELIKRDVETNGYDTGLQDLAILNAAMIPGWPKPGTAFPNWYLRNRWSWPKQGPPIAQVPIRKGGSFAQFENTRDQFFYTIVAYLAAMGVNSSFLTKAAIPGSRDRGRLLLLLLKLLGVVQQHDLPRQTGRECRQLLKA